MAPEDFEPLLKKLPTKQLVFVNTASASAPFLEALSGPGRTIVSATRSGAEHLHDAVRRLLRRRAEFTRGRRGQEQAHQRARGVSVRQGRGRRAPTSARVCWPPSTRCSTTTGTRRAAPIRSATGADGKVASVLSLGVAERGRAAVRSEAARAAPGAARDGAARRIASAAEGQHGPGELQSELEKLVTAIALKTREIRAAEGK